MAKAKTSHGFTEDGKRYILRDVHLMERADADLWNDELLLQIDHRGRIERSGFLQPNMTQYADPLRAVYVRDDKSGEFWSAPHLPVAAEPDEFEFSIGLHDLQWTVVRDDVEVRLQVVVPREHPVELWRVTLTNRGRAMRKLSLYSYFPLGLRGFLAQQLLYDEKTRAAIVDYFPYYVKYQDLPALQTLRNQSFVAADIDPDSHELSLRVFHGEGGPQSPDGLRQKKLTGELQGPASGNEAGAGIFQYQRSLKAKESLEVNFVLGPAHDLKEVRQLARRYAKAGALEKALKGQERFAGRYAPRATIETPDAEFNHFINYWLPRRTLMLARTLRHSFAPQGRNAIQDAMGGVFTDPQTSREWFKRIWTHQHTNGWMPHGMPFSDGVAQIPINQIPHKDINSWGPTALHFYVAETGDFKLLDEKIPFADKRSRKASLYDHVCLGLDWLLKDRTRRGLCRIGQGDWNDPLNMAGIQERGESVWLSEALVFALETWAEVAQKRKDKNRARRYRREAGKTRNAINALAWDGKWYARGFTDDGRVFGCRRDKEGKIFLNAQTWAMMADVADEKRRRACITSVEQHLMTPAGPMTLAPAFTRFRADIGKLTQKIPGHGENASVYSHACTFYAYALFAVGENEKGFEVLRTLLTGYGSNPLEKSGQLPLYVPNFFRGAPAGVTAGRTSHSPNTGTAPWYHRTAIAMLMGVRGELDGLRIDPRLPKEWKHARVLRQWRGATFDIQVVRDPKIEGMAIELDGEPVSDGLIPVQPSGSKHIVRVRLGG